MKRVSQIISILLHGMAIGAFYFIENPIKRTNTEIPVQLFERPHLIRPVAVNAKLVGVNKTVAAATADSLPAGLPKNIQPMYPSRARHLGQQGLVELLVEIKNDGSIKNLKVKKSSGFALLDSAALAAVREWEFVPARKNGENEESQVEVPVRFQLAN